MHVRTVFVICGSILFAGCGGPLEVSGVGADSDTFQDLPAVMRTFPVWLPTDTPLYDFEMRDGARRPSGGLRYTSDLSAQALESRFKNHAATLDCEISPPGPARLRATCGGSSARSLELYLDATGEGRQKVIVLFLETTPEFEEVSF